MAVDWLFRLSFGRPRLLPRNMFWLLISPIKCCHAVHALWGQMKYQLIRHINFPGFFFARMFHTEMTESPQFRKLESSREQNGLHSSETLFRSFSSIGLQWQYSTYVIRSAIYLRKVSDDLSVFGTEPVRPLSMEATDYCRTEPLLRCCRR